MGSMMTVRVRRKKRNLDQLREGVVRIGWFAGVRYEDGLSVAQVAQWQEYGTGGKYAIPARPFMRPVLHAGQTVLKERLRVLYSTALSNNTNTITALSTFGEFVLEKIQSQIDATISPPNAPITLQGGWLRTSKGVPFFVKPKRGSHPLVDTGFMRDSISYQTEEIKA